MGIRASKVETRGSSYLKTSQIPAHPSEVPNAQISLFGCDSASEEFVVTSGVGLAWFCLGSMVWRVGRRARPFLRAHERLVPYCGNGSGIWLS